MRTIGWLLVLLLLAAGGVYVAAGFRPGPAVTLARPEKFVGAATPIDVTIEAPGGRLSSVAVEFEQHGKRTSLFAGPLPAAEPADAPARVHITREVGRDTVPGLTSGAARVIVRASRPVAFGIRQVSTEVARDVQVRLERPRIEVLSTHHYINLGGSEMIVYRVQPADVASGVQVGDLEYPGFPAAGAAVPGVHITDPSVRVAFFALRYDQDPNVAMRLVARDEAGNTATAEFEHRTFPKTFRSSRIPLDEAFLNRVVPAILAGTTAVKPEGTTIEKFVVINSELRRKNAETIASMAAKTAPEMLWRGETFYPFVNNAVESAFADRRTYIYQGREVDRQTHLGFDLASVTHAPVLAANRGRVLFAEELGIYGNCVIIDHGMGVQSLYGHLSSIDVKPGAEVQKGDALGKSGITGLAGGDHLHFTMLVNGQMVNPVEWWDGHWIQDRVIRKLREGR
jgi:murein DD-endopeptidase MepM/ murein hydrolase activator NlpD